MNRWLSRVWRDERGVTAIEYAIIASLLSITIIAAVRGLGITLNGTFASISAGF